LYNAREVVLGDEVRAQVWTQATAAKDELGPIETFVKQRQRLLREVRIAQQFVIVSYSVVQHFK
jgi:hypothetical protein